MKKIFTLVSVALCAISANAQTEVLDVTSETVQTAIANAIANPVENTNPNFISVPQETNVFPENTWQSGDFSAVTGGTPIVMKDYIWTVSTTNIDLKAVSTPNLDAKAEESWQVVSNNANMELSTDDCSPKFTRAYKAKNGNASLAYKDFYEYNSDGDVVYRVGEQLWTIGCNEIPQKGEYYEITAKKSGVMKMGVYIHRIANVGIFVVEKETKQPLPVNALKLEGFMNNNTWDGFEGKVWHSYVLNENYQIEAGGQNRAVGGYLTFNVEAGKSYIVFNDRQQLGLYGYEFTPGTGTGIENVEAVEATKVAPKKVFKNGQIMIGDFNIAGQRVK